MRSIKFRGSNKRTNEYVYGYYVVKFKTHYICFINESNCFQEIEVIPETIGQYAGFNDRHNVEIYEKDYVKFSGYYYGDSNMPESTEVIEFIDNGWNDTLQVGCMDRPDWCEVVVHPHKLLKHQINLKS